MAVRFQLSDKMGDAIILVTAEAETVDEAELQFATAVGYIGRGQVYDAFAKGQTGPAVTTVTNVFPGAQVQETPAHRPPSPQAGSHYPPAEPQMPAAATPTCQHGQKVWKEGEKNGRKWKAWACPAGQNDPTRCAFQWVRD